MLRCVIAQVQFVLKKKQFKLGFFREFQQGIVKSIQVI